MCLKRYSNQITIINVLFLNYQNYLSAKLKNLIMKNSKMLISAIVVIFLQIPFLTNAQSGKVDFKAEQATQTKTYSPSINTIGVVKTNSYLKINLVRDCVIGAPLTFEKKKQYEFGKIYKNNSTKKVVAREFKPFVKMNKYKLEESNTYF